MYEMIEEFIKPELMVLVPVLYLIGNMIKDSHISDKYIPIYLGGISVTLSFLFIMATSAVGGWQEAFAALFSAFTQGVLCAGASVYMNQLIKQAGKIE